MNKRMRMAAGVIGLSFAVLAVAALSQRVAADDDEPIVVPKKSKEAVNKMAEAIAKGNKVGQEADLFFKDNKEPLKKTMWIFKPREDGSKGGVGIGAKPGVYEPDGIEAFILNQIGPRPKMKLNLKKDADDLNRLADITLAMAEITGKFVPDKAAGAKTPKAWNTANDDMKKAAQQLKDAVKANNNDDVKKAFLKLAASCNRCHETFRD